VYKPFKSFTYSFAHAFGAFRLTSNRFRRRVCILCYHGISRRDEHLWNSRLFISPETLEKRFELIHKTGFPVIPLDEAVDSLKNDSFPDNAIVITFDDGFYNNLNPGLQYIEAFNFPVTLYVATHNVVTKTPVFRHLISYMLWKAKERQVHFGSLLSDMSGFLTLSNEERRNIIALLLFRECHKLNTDEEHYEFCRKVSELVHVDLDDLLNARLFDFMTPDELRTFVKPGITLGLHTHSHPFEMTPEVLHSEIQQNFAELESIIKVDCAHFCYPSGNWSREMIPVLESHKLKSATTCDPGLNSIQANPFTLKRYLDSESTTSIELVAELYGFAEGIRTLSGKQKSLSVFHKSSKVDC
jgi:peptidoglycan/xylan/chitin deacetylase (PgdA/CDA1 family)